MEENSTRVTTQSLPFLFSYMYLQLEDERSQRSGDNLHPRDIDAFWLQRELNKYYADAEASRSKTEEVLEILKSAKDERELENKMMLLLGHDKFSFIRLLRKNKNMVLYCTLLATAQSAKDKKEIEEKMSSDPDLASILHALTETEQEDLIQVGYEIITVCYSETKIVSAKNYFWNVYCPVTNQR